MGWVVISRFGRFTRAKDPLPVVRETGWAPRSVRRGETNLALLGFDPRTVQPIASGYNDWANYNNPKS